MKKSLEVGANCWNGGEIYGSPEANSLQLLNAYFKKYPEDADKVLISIKGGCVPGTFAQPDGSPKNVRRSIDECLKWLGDTKLDLFECARVDPKVPVEESVGVIAEYVKAGKVGGVSLSEVGADTIRRVLKVTKVAAVEVEFSLLATDILSNGIAEVCAENNIPILAYSPLCRGFLTGGWKKAEDVPERLRVFPKFTGEAFTENRKLADEVERIAKEKGASVSQIALGWIRAVSGKNGLPTIIPIPGATTPERVVENMSPVDLSSDDLERIQKITSTFKASGDRYPEMVKHLINA